MKMRNLLVGTALAATVIGGSVVLPATTAPVKPASAMGSCEVIRTKHTPKVKCNPKIQLCYYYTYQTVCGP